MCIRMTVPDTYLCTAETGLTAPFCVGMKVWATCRVGGTRGSRTTQLHIRNHQTQPAGYLHGLWCAVVLMLLACKASQADVSLIPVAITVLIVHGRAGRASPFTHDLDVGWPGLPWQ
jgi:hypothetical protein